MGHLRDHTYICETFQGRNKKLGEFEKVQKMPIFGGWLPRQGVVAETYSYEGILAFGVRTWWPPPPSPVNPRFSWGGLNFQNLTLYSPKSGRQKSLKLRRFGEVITPCKVWETQEKNLAICLGYLASKISKIDLTAIMTLFLPSISPEHLKTALSNFQNL